MSIVISNEIQNYWKNFILQDVELSYLADYKFEAWSFGNTKKMATDLGLLVLEGKKTATCSLLRVYQGQEDEIPRVGVYSVLCDGDDRPIAVIYLTDTWVCKYSEVDDKHAYEEGEGDRSLAHWREVHREFFLGEYDGFQEHDELICERFRVVCK